MRLLSIVVSVNLIGVVISAHQSRTLIATAIALAVIHQTLQLVPGHENITLRVGAMLVDCVFIALASTVIVITVWREKDVTTDTILGGIAVYLLLGFVWGLAYSMIEILAPGSFFVTSGEATGASALYFQGGHVPRLLYYSYVTLTTLGYGDIVPATGLAGGVSVAEALTGQLFLAILIARLVGLYIAGRQRD
jgi:hypothetical protein